MALPGEKRYCNPEIYRPTNFMERYTPSEAVEHHESTREGHGIFYPMQCKDGLSAAMRISSTGKKSRRWSL